VQTVLPKYAFVRLSFVCAKSTKLRTDNAMRLLRKRERSICYTEPSRQTKQRQGSVSQLLCPALTHDMRCRETNKLPREDHENRKKWRKDKHITTSRPLEYSGGRDTPRAAAMVAAKKLRPPRPLAFNPEQIAVLLRHFEQDKQSRFKISDYFKISQQVHRLGGGRPTNAVAVQHWFWNQRKKRNEEENASGVTDLMKERQSWVGKTVSKVFGEHGRFQGTVTRYSAETDTYQVIYEDFDTEVVRYKDILALVVSDEEGVALDAPHGAAQFSMPHMELRMQDQTSEGNQDWMHMFRQLRVFAARSGHAHVRKDLGELGEWAVQQRRLHRERRLQNERVDLLQSIGFCFDGNRALRLRKRIEETRAGKQMESKHSLHALQRQRESARTLLSLRNQGEVGGREQRCLNMAKTVDKDGEEVQGIMLEALLAAHGKIAGRDEEMRFLSSSWNGTHTKPVAGEHKECGTEKQGRREGLLDEEDEEEPKQAQDTSGPQESERLMRVTSREVRALTGAREVFVEHPAAAPSYSSSSSAPQPTARDHRAITRRCGEQGRCGMAKQAFGNKGGQGRQRVPSLHAKVSMKLHEIAVRCKLKGAACKRRKIKIGQRNRVREGKRRLLIDESQCEIAALRRVGIARKVRPGARICFKWATCEWYFGTVKSETTSKVEAFVGNMLLLFACMAACMLVILDPRVQPNRCSRSARNLQSLRSIARKSEDL
jgi:hypothetical protein